MALVRGHGRMLVKSTRAHGSGHLLEEGVEAGEDAQAGGHNLQLQFLVLARARGGFLGNHVRIMGSVKFVAAGIPQPTSAITWGRLAPIPLPVAFLPNGH